MKFYIFSLLFLFFSIVQTKADHLVGGELQLNHISGDQYTITLNLYFNDITGDPAAKDNSVDVSIFSKSDNSLITINTLPLVSDDFIPDIQNNCSNSKVRTRLITYTSQVTLSSSEYNDPAGYYMSWERCCRNSTITNIQNPGSMGEVFYLEFPPVTKNNNSFINSSPVFKELRNIYACKDKPFYFDFSAKDIDGDSLVYSMKTPLRGHSLDPILIVPIGYSAPYDSVIWKNPFNRKNEIVGNPSLRINRSSGELFVTPSDTGLFVFAIDCEEFRKGMKIGEVRREFQIRIDSCPLMFAPAIQLRKPDQSYYKEGDSIKIDLNKKYCYTISVSDSTWDSLHIAELISLELSGIPEPNISITIDSVFMQINSYNDTAKTQICISTTCINGQINYAGYYPYQIIAKDNSCPVPLTDTLNIIFYILPDTNNLPSIYPLPKSRTIDLYVGDTYTLPVSGTDKDFQDQIILFASGNGFDINETGMIFNTISGSDSISSVFSWSPSCDNLKDGTNYQVWCIVKDNHCLNPGADTIEININLRDHYYPFTFNPPNLFTPNKDGLNENFTIPDLPKDYCDNSFVKIEIYNRWGSRIFESHERDFKWNAEKENEGIYFYDVLYTNSVFKSWLQIIR